MEKLEFNLEIKKSKLNKRQIIQNEIFELVKVDWALKRENWKRYLAFLKKYRLSERVLTQKVCVTKWKQSRDKDTKFIRPIKYKSTVAFFTSHLKTDDLFYILSVVKDKVNRNESPTIFIYSLTRQ